MSARGKGEAYGLIHLINKAYTERKICCLHEEQTGEMDVDAAVAWLQDNNVPVTLSRHTKGRRLIAFNPLYLAQVKAKQGDK